MLTDFWLKLIIINKLLFTLSVSMSDYSIVNTKTVSGLYKYEVWAKSITVGDPYIYFVILRKFDKNYPHSKYYSLEFCIIL